MVEFSQPGGIGRCQGGCAGRGRLAVRPAGPNDPCPGAARTAKIDAVSIHIRRPACTVATLVVALVVAGCGSGSGPAPGEPTTSATAPPPPSTSSAPPTRTTPQTGFGFQPLWPFADEAEAIAWQQQGGGSQPWHLDPAQTALGFAQSLGFTGIDRTTSQQIVNDEAWIGVGFALPNGNPSTAAVVHLARIGTGANAPWEVVGTRDDTLTLDTPRYGSTVTSPVSVGGLITGVDESLIVTVHRAGAEQPLGKAAPLPAGGEKQPWSTQVSYTGAPAGTVLTIVVSTGGHVADVERFAITGVVAR